MLSRAVCDFIEAHALLPKGGGVVAGLSGGVDSVVLVHVLRHAGYDVAAAHVNYGLREAAAGDEAFARRYCASFVPAVPLHVAHCDAKARAEREGASLQEAARHQRYSFFRRVADQEGVRHIAVAHHRRDQAETLLLNLIRGTGPEGLAGMRPQRLLFSEGEPSEEPGSGRRSAGETGASERWLIRPLLAIGRDEIEAYAETHGLPWRRDRTNRDPRFGRAALRRDVLPALEAHFPGAADRIARSAALMGRYVDEALRPELRRRFEAAARSKADGGRLDLGVLRQAPSVWQGRLLLEALHRWCPGAPRTQAAVRELRKLMDAQPGRRVVFGAHEVWHERGRLRFVRGAPQGSAPQGSAPQDRASQPLAPGRPARTTRGTVHAALLEARPDRLKEGGPSVAFLDADRLRFPLRVRPWQNGDRFQPLGMKGTRLVSDLLTDAKVPPSQRRRVCVVCSAEAIVWVVGHRLAEPAKVRADTQRVGRLSFVPDA